MVYVGGVKHFFYVKKKSMVHISFPPSPRQEPFCSSYLLLGVLVLAKCVFVNVIHIQNPCPIVFKSFS